MGDLDKAVTNGYALVHQFRPGLLLLEAGGQTGGYTGSLMMSLAKAHELAFC